MITTALTIRTTSNYYLCDDICINHRCELLFVRKSSYKCILPHIISQSNVSIQRYILICKY